MGFHHVYDNATIREHRWMIDEIKEHMDMLIAEIRHRVARNKDRDRRRLLLLNGHQTEEVSDDESVTSQDLEDADISESEDEEEESVSSPFRAYVSELKDEDISDLEE